MTFDDDFIQFRSMVLGRDVKVPLTTVGLEWPPPERVVIVSGGTMREAVEGDDDAALMKRVSMSIITDEQRAGMTHVCRGAAYEYVVQVSPATEEFVRAVNGL